ncbi:LOW QUALITY PROTEIN: taste receptor type 2 member 40-like [Pterocles gutturalis]
MPIPTSCYHHCFKTVFMFLNYSSLWFADWLSDYYCSKADSYTQSFFIWLKQRISTWMLIMLSLFYFATSLPFTWDISNMHDNFTAPLTNSSERRVIMTASLFLSILLFNTGIVLPLIVFCCILLMRSLWIHTRQVQNNATGFRDPSLEAHIGAIKSVFPCLFLPYPLRVFFSLPLSIREAMRIIVRAACPAGHYMVLIWSNPKFSELTARILHHTSCHVRTRSM